MSGYLNSNPYCVFVYVFQSEVCVVADWLAGLFCIYTYAPPPMRRTAMSARRSGEINPFGEVFIYVYGRTNFTVRSFGLSILLVDLKTEAVRVLVGSSKVK